MNQIIMSDSQTVVVTANPVDSSGKPGQLAPASVAVPSATSDNPSIATVTTDSTGLILTVTGVSPGMCNIIESGLTPTGNQISTSLPCTITGGPAVGFTFAVGTPTP